MIWKFFLNIVPLYAQIKLNFRDSFAAIFFYTLCIFNTQILKVDLCKTSQPPFFPSKISVDSAGHSIRPRPLTWKGNTGMSGGQDRFSYLSGS